MKNSFKDILASNLISVIIIFVLLYYFDSSGEAGRNIILVLCGFAVLTLYDFIKLRQSKKPKK